MSVPRELPPRPPVPDPDVVARRVDHEIVLVHLGTSEIFSLNATGSRLWELLQSDDNWTQIETTLQEEFDVGAEDLRASIAELITSLEAAGLVRQREP